MIHIDTLSFMGPNDGLIYYDGIVKSETTVDA